MQTNESRQILAKKKELNQELQQHEDMLARTLDELYALENHEPPAVPGMSQHQAVVSRACLIGAKNVQIEASKKGINKVRLKMAELVIKKERLGRAC